MILELKYIIENATQEQNIIINKYIKEIDLLQESEDNLTEEEFEELSKEWESKLDALSEYLKKNNLKLKDINGAVIEELSIGLEVIKEIITMKSYYK